MARKKKRIVIEVTDRQHELVEKAARRSGKTIKDFMLQEIIMQIKNIVSKNVPNF